MGDYGYLQILVASRCSTIILLFLSPEKEVNFTKEAYK